MLFRSVFARFESAEKDELFLESEPLAGRVFRIEKLSVGYVRDFKLRANLKFGVGIEASQHFTPGALDFAYGKAPASYLLFMRVKV